MGHQIIKQPNGKYAIWSSIVDHFILLDATPQEIIDFYIEKETEDIKNRVNRKIEQIERGKKPYYQFTQTWDESLDLIKEIHGENDEDLKAIETEIGRGKSGVKYARGPANNAYGWG